MKIILLCVGNIKSGPEKELIQQYRTRLTWPCDMREVVCRKSGTADQIKRWEGELLCQALEPGTVVIGLDERGKSLTSLEFANQLQAFQNQGDKSVTFIIGGADGLSHEVKSRCQQLISFGKTTWPHMLVRGMLVEQIYRAQQILSKHPYHRE